MSMTIGYESSWMTCCTWDYAILRNFKGVSMSRKQASNLKSVAMLLHSWVEKYLKDKA